MLIAQTTKRSSLLSSSSSCPYCIIIVNSSGSSSSSRLDKNPKSCTTCSSTGRTRKRKRMDRNIYFRNNTCTILFVILLFLLYCCSCPSLPISSSSETKSSSTYLVVLANPSSSPENKDVENGNDITTTTTTTSSSDSDSNNNNNHGNKKLFEQMWKNMQEQISMVMQEMLQQSSSSSSSSNSNTNSNTNSNNQNVILINNHDQQQQRSSSSSSQKSQLIQKQQNQQRHTSRYNNNYNTNHNNNNNIPLHQKGPGQHTYNRRKALYEHSLHCHLMDQLSLINQTTTTTTDTTHTTTATSNDNENYKIIDNNVNNYNNQNDNKNNNNIETKIYNETLLWNQIYFLYLNHDNSGTTNSNSHHLSSDYIQNTMKKDNNNNISEKGHNNHQNENENDENYTTSTDKQKTQSQTKDNKNTKKYSANNNNKKKKKKLTKKNKKDVDSRSSTLHTALLPFPNSFKKRNRQLIIQMFQHAYDNYMMYGWPASEVKPLSCTPTYFSLVKLNALTIIDSLDSLLVMNHNVTEFARAIERLKYQHYNIEHLFHVNQNVSVFETNIRVLGGLLSAHQLAIAYQLDNAHVLIQQQNPYSVLLQNVFIHQQQNYVNNNTSEEERNDNSSSNNNNNNVKWGYDDFIPNYYQTTKHSLNNKNNNNNTKNESCQKNEKDDITTSSRSDCDNIHTNNNNNTKTILGTSIDDYWIYDGFLLQLAEDIGTRLLPAFQSTKTGIPYGTINLIHGVPRDETKIASVAGGGTLSLEFELLSRLTNNPKYGNAAKLATRAIWMRRSKSPLNLMGKHIDIDKGLWTETLSGIGSNSDSFLEYLAKQYMLFPDDHDFWTMLTTAYQGVADHSRTGEWYVDTDMSTGIHGGSHRRVFESLAAFYPGLQVLLGEITPAGRTLNSMFMVRELLGFLPERFNFGIWNLDALERDQAGKHPLRPELLESCYFLHRATRAMIHKSGKRQRRRFGQHQQETSSSSSQNENDDIIDQETISSLMSLSSGWQWAADFALHKLNHTTYAKCGYAGVERIAPQTTGAVDSAKSRSNTTAMDEMPSFFLSETLKYLYLTFDDDDESIIHSDQDREWIFTTEAHPFHYVGKKLQHQQTPYDHQKNKKHLTEQNGPSKTANPIFRKEIDRLKQILEMKLHGKNEQQSNEQSHIHHLKRPRTCTGQSSCSSKANYDNLAYEKWTDNSSLRLYRDGIEKSNTYTLSHRRKLFDKKKKNRAIQNPIPLLAHINNNIHNLHDFTQRSLWVGPYSGPQHIRDIFYETDSKVNSAHLAYENLSLGSDLRKSCPNIYSSQLTWIQALNGGSIDYTDIFVSVTSDILSEHPNSFVTLGAAEALGSLGSGLYYGEHDDMGQSCPIIALARASSNVMTDDDSITEASTGVVLTEPSSDDELNGNDVSPNDDLDGLNDVILVESDIGQFEVSEFHDGSGFFIRNVGSDEKIVVNFVKDDPHRMIPEPLTQQRKVFEFATIYSHLRPVVTNASNHDTSTELEKSVVVADFNGNVFSCQLDVIETIHNENEQNGSDNVLEDVIIGTFPCAPALFGPSHISRLAQTPGGIVMEALLISPNVKNPTGCYDDNYEITPKNDQDDDKGWQIPDNELNDNNELNLTPDNNHDNDSSRQVFADTTTATGMEIPVLFVEEQEDKMEANTNKCCAAKNSGCIHMVHRGTCTFYEKTINAMERLDSNGVIVINHVDNEIFLMANAGDDDDIMSKYDDASLPLSILITQQDGASILEMIERVTMTDSRQGQFFTESGPVSEEGNNECSAFSARISLMRQAASVTRETGTVVNEQGDSNPVNIKWPVVRANEHAIQILTQFGWGIQAVAGTTSSTESGASSSRLVNWQLQLLRHSVAGESEEINK